MSKKINNQIKIKIIFICFTVTDPDEIISFMQQT